MIAKKGTEVRVMRREARFGAKKRGGERKQTMINGLEEVKPRNAMSKRKISCLRNLGTVRQRLDNDEHTNNHGGSKIVKAFGNMAE